MCALSRSSFARRSGEKGKAVSAPLSRVFVLICARVSSLTSTALSAQARITRPMYETSVRHAPGLAADLSGARDRSTPAQLPPMAAPGSSVLPGSSQAAFGQHQHQSAAYGTPNHYAPPPPSQGTNTTRILLLAHFSPELKTRDIQAMFGEWEDDRGGFKIKWSDDESCWIVFHDPVVGTSRQVFPLCGRLEFVCVAWARLGQAQRGGAGPRKLQAQHREEAVRARIVVRQSRSQQARVYSNCVRLCLHALSVAFWVDTDHCIAGMEISAVVRVSWDDGDRPLALVSHTSHPSENVAEARADF